MAACRFDDIDEGLEIVAIVLQRFRNRFSDGLEAGEMNNCIYLVGGEQVVRGLFVTEIHLVEWNILFACDFLYSLEASQVTV